MKETVTQILTEKSLLVRVTVEAFMKVWEENLIF